MVLTGALACPIEALAEDDDGPYHEFPFLADEAALGSVSIGDTSDGYLVGARRVEESERLKILPRQRERGLRFGTDALVATLEAASEALQRTNGRPLWLGNLSRRHGGDISYSVSHNSGRDADIAFAYLDGRGNPVDPPDLVPLNRAGLAPELGLRFDAPRTWRIVRALLESAHAEVQYLFISVPLKTQLLAHAKSIGEPAGLVERAAEILRQPAGSGAHDDHLHLRIYCTERDVLAGCMDSGVAHPWHREHLGAKQRRIEEVVAFLGAPEAEQRRRAIDRLVLLGAEDRLDAMARGIDDVDAGVRRSAVAAIGAFTATRHAAKLASLWDREHDLTVKVAIVQAATELGCETSGRLLAKAVGLPERMPGELERALDAFRATVLPAAFELAPRLLRLETVSPDPSGLDALMTPNLPLDESWLLPLETAAALEAGLQLSAIDAAARAERLEPVTATIELLRSSDPTVRGAADRALSFMTNLDSQDTGPKSDPTRAHLRWSQAAARAATGGRDAWLVAGFRAKGFNVRELDRRYAWELVRATNASDHLSFNAQRTLMRLFKRRPPSLSWSKKDACQHWLRWLSSHPTEVRAGAAPEKLHEACDHAQG